MPPGMDQPFGGKDKKIGASPIIWRSQSSPVHRPLGKPISQSIVGPGGIGKTFVANSNDWAVQNRSPDPLLGPDAERSLETNLKVALVPGGAMGDYSLIGTVGYSRPESGPGESVRPLSETPRLRSRYDSSTNIARRSI